MHCTNEPNVSIPQLANLLIERSQNANWVVVFKALITVHHMLCYGNEVGHGLGFTRIISDFGEKCKDGIMIFIFFIDGLWLFAKVIS